MKKPKSIDVLDTFSKILQRRGEAGEVSALHSLRAMLVQDVEAAHTTNAQPSIDLAASRLAEFDGYVGEVAERIPAFDAATAAASAAVLEHDQAAAVDAYGSIDAKVALENAQRLTVARAARIVRDRELVDVTISTWQPVRNAMGIATREDSRIRAKVLEQTRSLMGQAWSEVAPEYASELGRDQGRASTAKHEAWWAICESLVIAEHETRAAEQRAKVQELRLQGRELRVDPEDATRALKNAFAARRGGLAVARAEARAKIAALNSELTEGNV